MCRHVVLAQDKFLRLQAAKLIMPRTSLEGRPALLQLCEVQRYLLVDIVQMPSVMQHRNVARKSVKGGDVLCLQLADSRSLTLACSVKN